MGIILACKYACSVFLFAVPRGTFVGRDAECVPFNDTFQSVTEKVPEDGRSWEADFDTNFTFGAPQTHTGEMWMIPFREHTVHANEQLKDS